MKARKTRINNIALKLGVFTAIILSAYTTSYAGTVTNTSKATATLASNCKISGTDISFGDITAKTVAEIGQTVTSNSNLTVLCSNNLSYSIAMNVGTSFTFDRHLKEPGGDLITYHIAPDAAFQQYWYTYSSQDYRVSGTGNGTSQTIPVYGSVNKGFYKPATYSDTLIATIYY